MEIVKTKLNVPADAKIRVTWDDEPINYSREYKNRIKSYFAKKYGVHKNNISVVFKPVKINEKGEKVEITGAGIDNIMDFDYQRSLMKEWLERQGIETDFSRIIKLDNKVNSELDTEVISNNSRRWELKWIMIDNFLSFGPDNYFNLNKYNGLNIITSEPANQGGKCVRYNTNIKIKYDPDKIIKKLGFLPDELK